MSVEASPIFAVALVTIKGQLISSLNRDRQTLAGTCLGWSYRVDFLSFVRTSSCVVSVVSIVIHFPTGRHVFSAKASHMHNIIISCHPRTKAMPSRSCIGIVLILRRWSSVIVRKDPRGGSTPPKNNCIRMCGSRGNFAKDAERPKSWHLDDAGYVPTKGDVNEVGVYYLFDSPAVKHVK